MFTIDIVRIISEGILYNKWENQREFVSPNKKSKIIFYNPYEFSMGAYEWQLRLIDNDIDITKDHPLLLKNKKMCPYVYQPWSCDSKRLILVNKDSREELYDILNKQYIKCAFDFFAVNILGAQNITKFLLTTREEVFIMDLEGRILTKVDFKTPPHEYPSAYWLKSNNFFFVIGRESESAPTKMIFYDTNSHKKIQAINLDPKEIVPYEYEKYKDINRKEFSLATSNSNWTAGWFLDRWSAIDFDEENDMLRLKICRPTSEVFKKGFLPSHYECKVKDIEAEIKIRNE